jgi:hypothetical protein
MSKTRIPINPPAQVGGIIQARLDAAQNYLALQKHSNKWKPLLASVPVGFMDLRTGMCRWPIDDSNHLATFRFCGCACSLSVAYCETHQKMALTPSQSRASVPRKYPPPAATKSS